MAEPFTLIVPYKGESKQIDGELRMYGYSYKIAMWVDGIEILFEPDEERNFRAVLPYEDKTNPTVNIELLRAIVTELETAFK
jgi:hypothetical protein